MKFNTKQILSILCAAIIVSPIIASAGSPEKTPMASIESRVGKLSFENSFEAGIPVPETVELLFEEIDFQRACQAYIWAMPFMGFYEWMFVYDRQKVERGQLIYAEGYDAKLGGLTFNTSTPYLWTFLDLRDGPVMAEMPDAPVRGAMHTMWQVGIAQLTKPGKYVFVGPGQEIPTDLPDDAQAFQSDTSQIFFGIRLMSDTREKRMQDMKRVKLVNLETGAPVSKRAPLFLERGEDLRQARGLGYWESLHKAINMTPVREQDRIMIDFLRPLGVQIGKPFKPDSRQKRLLEEAVLVGEAMAKTIDFNKSERLPQSAYGPAGNSWEIATAALPEQNRDSGVDLDGRAAWLYEAVTNDIAMHGMKNGGWGQVYLDNYRASDGNGLNGSFHYTLDVPGDVPLAETFWTVTVYNVDNRAILHNELKRADVGSNVKGTVRNDDGSYTFHFSPELPDGVAKSNWVQTNPKENWFVYFRAYSPSKEFVAEDPRTILPNFKRVK
jgi:hypothetical protein